MRFRGKWSEKELPDVGGSKNMKLPAVPCGRPIRLLNLISEKVSAFWAAVDKIEQLF